MKANDPTKENGTIKCIVWDLDNTLWNGTLLKDESFALQDDVVTLLRELDERGILHSIASRNNYHDAMQKLEQFGVADFFLYPQIGWGSKVASIETIASQLNMDFDAIAFIDDQKTELEEVRFSLPQVTCIDAADLEDLLEFEGLKPRFQTADAKRRRQMYRNDIERNQAEAVFVGAKEAFLTSLNMELTIFPAREDDLARAEELTVRTHQLNSTGYTYTYEELDYFRKSDTHLLLMARLDDKFGAYGHIGLALVECNADIWALKLLLMSCRVIARGGGSVLLTFIMHQAKKANVVLHAEFLENERNRMMNITYRFAQFREIEKNRHFILFENDLTSLPPFPDYIKLHVE